MDLAGRVALVTGGSRGIGAAVARRLARAGLRVAVMGRDAESLARVAAEISGSAVVADVAEPSALLSAAARIEATLGPIDVLVNNAGIAESAPLARTSDAAWSNALAINVTAPFVLCRALVPAMARRNWGRVVCVASNAGLTGYPYTSAYGASKHAVVGLVRALAAEFARSGVTVNAVCPGFVDTELATRAVQSIVESTGRDEASARAALAAQSPQGRLMTVDEVAHAVFALLPHEARGINGQAIALDGGRVMG